MRHPNVWGIWTPLSVTKHAFFVLCMYRVHPNIFQTCGHPNMWGHTHIWECSHIFRASKHRGAPYVWMPSVHTQHKESMLCQNKGMSVCHLHLDAFISLDTLIYFNAPLYVGMPPCLDGPCMLGSPLCLNAPCMLGHLHMFECPLYIHNTKKARFIR